MKKDIYVRLILSLAIVLLPACSGDSWNSPYPAADAGKNILYNVFIERPKHLDPAQSYSSNEIQLTAQIYEPPLQYHYLKQPYALVPLTVSQMPVVRYFNKNGYRLSDNANVADIAYTIYEISIKPGIFFQPHPAFAVDEQGEYIFHDLSDKEISEIYQLSDFPLTSTRELTAKDYIFQIKRLAHPRLHSPVFELMADYILGLREFAATLENVVDERHKKNFYLDLNKFSLKGVQVVDDYTYRIKIKGKYPQFLFWLTMPFFAPIPWEAERFYSQQGLIEKNISLDWYPVGTGAYMMTENNPNQIMVLEKNPNFHGEFYPTEGMPDDEKNGLLVDAGQPLPFIDKIVYSRDRESIPRWNKFLQGYYDASGIGSDSFDQAIQLVGQGEATVTDAMVAQGIRLEAATAPLRIIWDLICWTQLLAVFLDKHANQQESFVKLFQLQSIMKNFFPYLRMAEVCQRMVLYLRAFPVIEMKRVALIRLYMIGQMGKRNASQLRRPGHCLRRRAILMESIIKQVGPWCFILMLLHVARKTNQCSIGCVNNSRS